MVNHLAIKNVSFRPRLHVSGSRSQPLAVAPCLHSLSKAKPLILLETRHPFPASPPEHLVLPNWLSPLCQANHQKKNKIPLFPSGVAGLLHWHWSGCGTGGQGAPGSRVLQDGCLIYKLTLKNHWVGDYSTHQPLLGRMFSCFGTGETEGPRRPELSPGLDVEVAHSSPVDCARANRPVPPLCSGKAPKTCL